MRTYRTLHLILTILILSCQLTHCTIFNDSQIIATVCECAPAFQLVTSITVVNTNSESITISGNCENYFFVSPLFTNGIIRVEVKEFGILDHESDTQNSFECKVYATAADSTESYVSVFIFVTDCNDNAPLFSSGILSASVAESEDIGHVVFTVEATDTDSGTNAEINFFIDDTSGKFQIGEVTGIITLAASLDYETQDEYDFIVTVTDSGGNQIGGCSSTSLSTDNTIRIKVSDSTDTPPIFVEKCCYFSVAECDVMGTEIGTYLAYDGDLGVDDDIEFSFLSSTPPCFSLASNGLLTVSTDNCIDRETSETYTLQIEATEVNQPRQRVRADFDVRVTDCNDVTPEFISLPNNFSVNEGLSADSTLFSIQTFDGDQVNTNNSRTFVTLLPDGNTDSIFAINSHSSALITTQLLDRERYPDGFQLTLRVSDYGTPPLTSTQDVLISLTDINDNPPTFKSASYSETISENLAASLLVLQLDATDNDIGVNSELYFYIISGNDAQYFSLNPVTGELLTTDTTIDRETFDRVDLIVFVVDSGANPLQTTASVTILISDENDNTPVFSSLLYDFLVEEELDPATLALQVVATDIDDVLTGNGNISYSIVSGDAGFYYSDYNNAIHSTLRFDRETRDWYQLVIQASDNGTPSLSSTTSVTISVTDANDNPPIFTRDTYVVGFSENAEFNTKIIQFMATDADLPPYSTVLFEFVTLIQGFLFDSETGKLVTDQLFVGRAGEVFEFTVTAYDNERRDVFNSVSQPVKVIVITDTQRLIALVDSPVEIVKELETTVRDLLEDITKNYVNIEEFIPVTMDNQVDSSQTQVVFHVIDVDTWSVLSADEVLRDADERFEDVLQLFDVFSVMSISPFPETISSPYLFTALISIVSALALLLLLTCCCCCLLFIYLRHYKKNARKNFERDLDEAGNLLTQKHARSFSSLSAAGTSGLFAQSNAAVVDNPLWIHPYDNMGSLYSSEATLYETKELIIDLFAEDIDDYSLYSVPSRVNTSLIQGPFEMASSDSTSSMDTEGADVLPNSGSSNFDFPSTSTQQRVDVDAISDSDVVSII